MRLRIKIALRNRRAWTHEQRVDRAFAAGLALVAVGFGLVYMPLLLIVGGTLLAAVAWKYGTAAPAQQLLEPADRESDD